jgi:hypothetical protein
MTLPFLPRDVNILRGALAESTTPTRDAFQAAFKCTLNAVQFTGHIEDPVEYTPKRAYELLVNSNWMDAPNLLQLQALLLLVLESAHRGTHVIQGGHGNTPWQYLAEALDKGKSIDQFSIAFAPPRAEPDTHYLISRSIVLSMTILDAFFALGHKKQGLAMDRSLVTMWDQDVNFVGQRCYRLAHMARVLSRLSLTRIAESQDDYELHRPTRVTGTASKPLRVMPGDTDIILRLKTADIDLLQAREVPDDPILQMAFWYTRAQIEVTYYPLAIAKNILQPIRRIVELLGQIPAPGASSSPIIHHFSGLAAHLLIQLCDFANTKDEASMLLVSLKAALKNMISYYDRSSFDAGILRVVEAKTKNLLGSSTSPAMGLEHLADVAVAGTNYEQQGGGSTDAALQAAAEAAAKAAQAHMSSSISFDGSLLSQQGYLEALLNNVPPPDMGEDVLFQQ